MKRFTMIVAATLSIGAFTTYVKAKPLNPFGQQVYWAQECRLVAEGMYECQLYRNDDTHSETVGDFEFTFEEAHHFAVWLNVHEEEIGEYYCEEKRNARH